MTNAPKKEPMKQHRETERIEDTEGFFFFWESRV